MAGALRNRNGVPVYIIIVPACNKPTTMSPRDLVDRTINAGQVRP